MKPRDYTKDLSQINFSNELKYVRYSTINKCLVLALTDFLSPEVDITA